MKEGLAEVRQIHESEQSKSHAAREAAEEKFLIASTWLMRATEIHKAAEVRNTVLVRRIEELFGDDICRAFPEQVATSAERLLMAEVRTLARLKETLRKGELPVAVQWDAEILRRIDAIYAEERGETVQ